MNTDTHTHTHTHASGATVSGPELRAILDKQLVYVSGKISNFTMIHSMIIKISALIAFSESDKKTPKF